MIEWIENITLFGIKLINFEDLTELIFRLIFNTVILLAIVHFPYMCHSRRCSYTFSFMAVGTTVFLLCFLLNSVKLELGFALGLFAIFGIIRYRTDAIPFKQMSYLFVVIGLSVINALANKKVSYGELLLTNLAILAALWLLESYLKSKGEGSIKLIYENISMVHTDQYELLTEELRARTGFDIRHIEIVEIDYLKDVAIIVIHFRLNDNKYFIEEELPHNG